MKKIKIILIFLLLSMQSLFTGCSGNITNVSSNKSQSNFVSLNEITKPGTFKMSYDNFDGTEVRTFNVIKGNKVLIKYNSSVKSGSLSISVSDAYGNLIGNLPVNKKGTIKTTVKATGRISITVTGKSTTGGFSVYWQGVLF